MLKRSEEPRKRKRANAVVFFANSASFAVDEVCFCNRGSWPKPPKPQRAQSLPPNVGANSAKIKPLAENPPTR
jgi:hypothetical protein